MTFSTQLGSRHDLAAYGLNAHGRATLYAGANAISSLILTVNGNGNWYSLSTSSIAGNLDFYAGQNLSVVLSNEVGAQVSFDKVSVDVTSNPVPEPATLSLVGLGVASMLRRRRQSR